MNVRAKFQCQSVNHILTHSPGDQTAILTFAPVYDNGKGENATWSKYTPQGKLEMTVTNPAAVAAFEVGKSYYLDFTPAD